jgi:small nuclear ribonucleoprotein (snRNP)-like protein
MDWKLWIGKNVFIKLSSGEVYNGEIVDSDTTFIEIVTKFDERIVISCSNIIKVVDETYKIKREERYG